jgi:hypothetical protein
MAQFPVSDQQGIQDGLNYVLAGPVSSGQNFVGFSDWLPASVTGNFRVPYTSPDTMLTPSSILYIPPMLLGTSEMLSGDTWKYTFAAPMSAPFFALGQSPFIIGCADSFYDVTSTLSIGVIESTATYIILRTSSSYALQPPTTGGTISLDSMNKEPGSYFSTDCNGKVTVTNTTDRVFINSQLTNSLYIDPVGVPPNGKITYTVVLNRYKAENNTDPTNPGYLFPFDKLITQKTYTLDTTTITPITGDGTYIFKEIETIFLNIMDNPPPGYYWYITEIRFDNDLLSANPAVQVSSAQLTERSFTAQVLKA